MSMLLEVLKVRKKLCNSYFVLVIFRSLIYSIASVLEDKASIALGQPPHQTEPADTLQLSSVAASDNVKDEVSKRSRINDEDDSDEIPDLKREYAKALTVFCLLY